MLSYMNHMAGLQGPIKTHNQLQTKKIKIKKKFLSTKRILKLFLISKPFKYWWRMAFTKLQILYGNRGSRQQVQMNGGLLLTPTLQRKTYPMCAQISISTLVVSCSTYLISWWILYNFRFPTAYDTFIHKVINYSNWLMTSMRCLVQGLGGH